jgi:hypothetical protein
LPGQLQDELREVRSRHCADSLQRVTRGKRRLGSAPETVAAEAERAAAGRPGRA